MNRKGKTVSLVRPVVRILADNHDLNIIKRALIQRFEHFIATRVHHLTSLLLFEQKWSQAFREVGLFDLCLDYVPPALVHCYYGL